MSLRRERTRPADDLRQRVQAVVDPLFSKLSERPKTNGSMPRVVLNNRQERARERLIDALVSRGSPKVPADRRAQLEQLIRQWAARDFEPGFAEAEELEIACAQERDLVDAQASGDSARLLAVREQAHRRAVVVAYGSIEIRGLQMSARVHQDLDVAFVPLHIEDPSQATTVQVKKGMELRHIPRLEATEVVKRHDRVLIVGAPGSGKTTLVAYLAAMAAAGRTDEGVDDRVPFVVAVRSLSMTHLDEMEIASVAGCDVELVRVALKQKRAMVLVDGLDEAGEERLEEMLPSIQSFARAHPGNKFILTTRPGSGPDDARTCLEGFASTRLLPMTRDEVYLFIDRWCLAAELSIQKDRKKARKDAEQAAADLKGRVQESRAVEHLAETPLMASVLCIVHRFLGQRVPERRAALYEACTNVLLYEWDRAKFPEGSLIGRLDAQTKRVLLGGVARSMHNAGLAEISRDEIIKVFAERLPRVGHAASEAAEIVAEIQDRSGLLVERRPGMFAFSHLTFQEYLTAVEYVRTGSYEALAFHYADAWWHEVIALAAGLPGADAGRIVQALLKHDGRKTSTATMIAAQCLETAIEVTASLRQKVEKKVAQLIPPRSDLDARRVQKFGLVAGPVLLRALPTADVDAQARIARALGQIGYEAAGGALARLMSDSSATGEAFELDFDYFDTTPEQYEIGSHAAAALVSLARRSDSCRKILESAIPIASDEALVLLGVLRNNRVLRFEESPLGEFFRQVGSRSIETLKDRRSSTAARRGKQPATRAARSG